MSSHALSASFALALGASSILFACGTSTPEAPAAVDAGADAAEPVVDATAPPAGDALAPPPDDASPSDALAPVDAADAGHCWDPGVTQDACRTCCEDAYPAGYKVFANATLTCACGGSLCGPPDGGVGEGGVGADDAAVTDAAADGGGDDAEAGGGDDGGLYGHGVCTATCNRVSAPDPACNTCIFSTLGSVSSLGPCGSYVLSQCVTDPSCSPYFGCVNQCP